MLTDAREEDVGWITIFAEPLQAMTASHVCEVLPDDSRYVQTSPNFTITITSHRFPSLPRAPPCSILLSLR